MGVIILGASAAGIVVGGFLLKLLPFPIPGLVILILSLIVFFVQLVSYGNTIKTWVTTNVKLP
jgi:hypothetical protein